MGVLLLQYGPLFDGLGPLFMRMGLSCQHQRETLH